MIIDQQPISNGVFYGQSKLAYAVSDANYTDTGFKYVAEIYIWNGVVGSLPANPTYTLYRTPNTAGSGIFEINGLLPYSFETEVVLNIAIVFNYTNDAGGSGADVQSDTVFAMDGYADYSGALNAAISIPPIGLLLTNSSPVQFNELESYYAVRGANTAKIIFYDSGKVNIGSQSFTASVVNTDDIIQGFFIPASTVKYLRLADSGETSFSQYYDVEKLTECKYELITVSFFNRYGVPDNLVFEGKRTDQKSFVRNRFNRTNADYSGSSLTKDTELGNYAISSVKANSSLVLNTGYKSEDNAVAELFRSHRVFIDSNPYIIKDSSFTVKTKLNDKLINYTIMLEAAYDD